MSDQDVVAMGEQAARLLLDPVFKDALIGVEKKYIEQWRNSGVADSLGREKSYLLLRALSDLSKEIQIMIGAGQLAKASIDRSQRRS